MAFSKVRGPGYMAGQRGCVVVTPTTLAIVAFAFAFGGVVLGLWLRRVLPKDHLDKASATAIKHAIGLIVTITALVLGLVTASAKSSFDVVNDAVKASAVQILALDRALARYGPETAEIRTQLKQALGERIEMIWPSETSQPVTLDPATTASGSRVESLADAIRSLEPRDDRQRGLQSRAVELAEGMLQARWLAMAVTEASLPTPFLVVLLFWLTVAFTGFGMLAPSHATMISVLFVCALSIGAALFLVLEMDGPFDGLLRVSGDPLRFAYTHVNR